MTERSSLGQGARPKVEGHDDVSLAKESEDMKGQKSKLSNTDHLSYKEFNADDQRCYNKTANDNEEPIDRLLGDQNVMKLSPDFCEEGIGYQTPKCRKHPEHHHRCSRIRTCCRGTDHDHRGKSHGLMYNGCLNNRRKHFCSCVGESCAIDQSGPSLCKSQSLLLTRPLETYVRPSKSEVNHISLYDEGDELLALERWRNAGLALRRVLNKSKNRVGNSDTKVADVSPECQNVVDEIFDDVDDDTLKTLGSSSTCSANEAPDLTSSTDNLLPRQPCTQDTSERVSLNQNNSIWDSKLYPTTREYQFSPEYTNSEPIESRTFDGGFPWRQGATFLGACLFPQCLGIIGGGRRFRGVRDGEVCNGGGEGDMCNMEKLTCDNLPEGVSAIHSEYGPARSDRNVCDSGISDESTHKSKNNRLSWCGEDGRFLDSEEGDQKVKSSTKLSGSQCTSSFHSEDSHDATKSSGYYGDKGGDSEESDYSSADDGCGGIYFLEDSEKFDTVPRRRRPKDKTDTTFKKTLQREKKKKLVHARKTHRRKSSSSSTDVPPDENNAETPNFTETTDTFQTAYDACPTFVTCSAFDNYEEITPPRRSAVARHFLDRARSSDHLGPGFFRQRDGSNSELSTLPSFDLSPLSRLPSFLQSLQNSVPPDYFENEDNFRETIQSETPETEVLDSPKGDNSDECKGDNSKIEADEKLDSSELVACGETRTEEGSDFHKNETKEVIAKGGNSLLSPESWIKLIDEIYEPIVCQDDLKEEESTISDVETEQTKDKTPDFFRCLDGSDKSSDSGDADDEFECECDHCQLLRSLDRPSRFLPTVPSAGETRDDAESTGETTLRGESWESDWTTNYENTFDITMDDLRPLEPFLLSLQDLPQDPVDLMFQNVITQMLAVHPELLGDQAPPPVSQNVIDGLPSIMATSENIDADLTCPVCLCHFELGENMTYLPCKHRYHPLCIQAWLSKSGTCPVCRRSLHQGQGRSQEEEDV